MLRISETRFAMLYFRQMFDSWYWKFLKANRLQSSVAFKSEAKPSSKCSQYSPLKDAKTLSTTSSLNTTLWWLSCTPIIGLIAIQGSTEPFVGPHLSCRSARVLWYWPAHPGAAKAHSWSVSWKSLRTASVSVFPVCSETSANYLSYGPFKRFRYDPIAAFGWSQRQRLAANRHPIH